MNRQPKSWLLAALLLFSLLPGLALAHKLYDRIVVFGDSLSDPGNAYFLLGRALTPPYETLDELLIPDAPYAIGGNRFSNGPTWIEQLARPLKLKSSVGPAFPKMKEGEDRRTNYAVGGARARDNGADVNLALQVITYFAQGTVPAGEKTLFVIEIGNNDVRDAIAALALDPGGASSGEILNAALTSIANNIILLHASGAREFFIVTATDLSLTPAIRTLDAIEPGAAIGAAIISSQFNMGLDGVIAQLEAALPNITIRKFDIYALLHDIVATPGKYRLSNVTDACIKPNVPPYRCSKAKRYLFWDGIHPTRSGHKIFAQSALKLLPSSRAAEKHEQR